MKSFFTLLKEQHKETKDLFKEILEQEEIDRDKTNLLCEKLLLHMELEETYFYPVTEDIKATEEMAVEAELEHKEAKKFIRSLQKNNLEDVEFKVKLELLQAAIEHHIKEEENEFLPKAKEKLSDDEIDEISEKMHALVEKKSEKKTPVGAR